MAVKTSNPMQATLTTAKGLGSAKSGTEAWMGMHVSSVALFPLTLFVLASFFVSVVFGDGSYETALAWVRTPWNGISIILLITTAFYHGAHGLQSGIVEDYIHHPAANLIGMMAIKFMGLTLALTGVLATLKIMLGA